MGELIINKKESLFPATKQEAVYNILRENIINGHLKQGTRLVFSRLAKELGVSEIPVREAVRMLEAQGLVTMTPHSGALVSELDSQDVKEISIIRGLLEGYAAKASVPYITQSHLEKLRNLIKLMEKCVEENDDSNFGKLNRQFHSTIYELCPYKRLHKMIYELWDGYERTRSVFALDPKHMIQSLNEHKEILDTIETGNSERVEYLVRMHKIKSAESLIAFLEKEDSHSKGV